jgi:hypothetical protein
MTYAKYRNRRTVIDGITFDSKGEALRYIDLKLLQCSGDISDLRLQPEYELQPSFRHDGRTVRKIVYRADFEYRENGRLVAEDYKGARTQVFDLKRKLFMFRYPHIQLRITS